MERGMTKLTSTDKSEQRNDETQTCKGFSKLMAIHWTHLRPKIRQICGHKNL